ncbi:hypothetical protein RQP46_007196 [Phenoliferia psychrophenolica]
MEIIEHILEFAGLDDSGLVGTNPSDLLSAALVCSRWREAGQRALCRHVDFDGTRRRLEPARWLASEARSRFRVKTMRINHLQAEMVMEILGQCGSDMGELSIMDCEGLDFGVLYMPCFATIKRLRLIYPETIGEPVGPMPPLIFRPSHLELNVGTTNGDLPSPGLLHALFTSARNTLVSLDLCFDTEADQDVADAMSSAFALIAPRLRQLTLAGSPPAIDFVAHLSSCKRLESLKIETFTHSPGDWIPCLDAIGRRVPASLRVLTVSGYPFRDVTRKVIHTLAQTGFRQIKELRYPSFRPEYLADVDLLRSECGRLGIKLAFRDELLS